MALTGPCLDALGIGAHVAAVRAKVLGLEEGINTWAPDNGVGGAHNLPLRVAPEAVAVILTPMPHENSCSVRFTLSKRGYNCGGRDNGLEVAPGFLAGFLVALLVLSGA